MRLPLLILGCIVSGFVVGQCFNPPDTYTLYSTSNAAAYGTASTGFETMSSAQSGLWSVNAVGTDAGVSATFTDNEGRSSTIDLIGTGQLAIDAEITENFAVVDNCTQTYTVAEYAPVITANPSLPATCPLNIVLVLDESGSIADNMSTQVVRDAVMALANNLNGTGSQLALVEFASTASRIALNGSMDLTTVDGSLITALGDYFTNDYVPVSAPTQLIGGTNWEDALTKADEVAGADLIFMLTDGRPTFYSIGSGMGGSMGIAGEGDLFDLTALKEAQDVANSIKTSGKRIFLAGLDFPSNIQSMIDISGPNAISSISSIQDLASADYTLVAPTSLVSAFEGIGGVCEEPEPIPTMGEWGLISLSLILLIFAITAIKQPKSALA